MRNTYKNMKLKEDERIRTVRMERMQKDERSSRQATNKNHKAEEKYLKIS